MLSRSELGLSGRLGRQQDVGCHKEVFHPYPNEAEWGDWGHQQAVDCHRESVSSRSELR